MLKIKEMIKQLFCRHLYVEWTSGYILKEPYCFKCGKLKPKRKWHFLTKLANESEKVEE